MKKALLKNSVKEIKDTLKRFISILLMSFLGVGFFAGLRAASPDMIDTFDQFYEDNQVYDIQIISTLGLTDDDIEELEKVKKEHPEYIYYVSPIEKINSHKIIDSSTRYGYYILAI